MLLNVCSLGDPLNRRTWSGTAFALCEELRRRGRLGDAFASDFARSYRRPLAAASALYYGAGREPARGRFCRYFNSSRVARRLRSVASPHTLHLGTLDMPFASANRPPHQYLYCDSTWHAWSRYMKSAPPTRWARDAERLEMATLDQFEAFFPISEYIKEDLVQHYGIAESKITVVGTGRGGIVPYFGAKDYRNGRILFVAKERFEDKGGAIVLEAFDRARQRNPQLQLTIVGQGSYLNFAAPPNVDCRGFVKLEELQRLFQTHSLFLMPAANEPWGLVYLEALACRMPIMGLRRNAFPELSGDGKFGYIIDNFTPDELARQILAAIDDPVGLEAKGTLGQEASLKKYTWERTVRAILDVIDAREGLSQPGTTPPANARPATANL